jgi:enamine deaminase RidA (YjgF/YER057c/UK114 family)
LEFQESEPSGGPTVSVVQTGKLVIACGALPWKEGRMAYKGRLGLEVKLDTGKQAAFAACMQALSAIRSHFSGTLNKIKQVVSLRGYVAAGGEFYEHHKVLDGASQLLSDVFGAAGKHTRTAVGVASLPFGASVEIELIVETK